MADAMPTRAPSFSAIVPIKPLGVGKSRLALPPDQRRALMVAFAADTVIALTGCPEVAAVIVVSADPGLAAVTSTLGARLVHDPDTTTLDEAVAVAVRAGLRDRPGDGVLVVPADLPCLQPRDVTEVLRLARGHRGAFVPDRTGCGTTIVVSQPGEPVRTRYGRESARRHTSIGLWPIAEAPVRARHDVDTIEDVRDALPLGLGAHAAALVGDGSELGNRARQSTG